MEGKFEIGRIIRAKNISDAWYRGLNVIWNHGNAVADERGNQIKEFMDLMIVIEDPYTNKIPRDTVWNEERLEEYAKQLISGENEQDFEYTYGQRLRNWDGKVDQIEYVIEKLQRNPTSRRAIAITWIPPVDTKVSEVPCMMLDDFKIRDGKVHLTTLFRSHDFGGAYPANLYGLSRLLEHVADRLDEKPGTITTVSISAHIYDHDWDLAESIVKGVN